MTDYQTIIDGKKQCSKCGKWKDISEFPISRQKKSGYYSSCKQCKSDAAIKKYHENIDESRRKGRESSKKYVERKKKYAKRRYDANREEVKRRAKISAQKYKPKRRIYKNNYEKQRRASDPNYKLFLNLKTRFYALVFLGRGVRRTEKMQSLIGCTFPELKSHIESHFDENMTWDNYGSYWHIDHIIPCAAFDLTKVEEQKKCFNWTNLQPMVWIDNISKGDKLPDGTRARYIQSQSE